MRLLAQQLGRYAGSGRPVFDPTNLTGQLGLKLEPARGPVDVLAIDRVTPPSEN